MADLISTGLIVSVSLWLIVISLIVIIISVLIIFLKKKSREEAQAVKILARLAALKEGRVANVNVGTAPKLEIKKEESSLKAMLIKKFKPKIESQLSAKVTMLDFNAKENNFLALVEISGVKLLLTLDSSGKIIDYKKVKQK